MCTVKAGSLVLGDGVPKICVPITGHTFEEIETQTVRVKKAVPDLAEWRADLFDEIMDRQAAGKALERIGGILGDIPLLFTYRTEKEGGAGVSDDEAYAALLLRAAEKPGISLIDIEIEHSGADIPGLVQKIREAGKAVIASRHDFTRTPSREEREAILDRLLMSGADILKLAVMPQNAADVTDMLAWTEASVRRLDRPLITMAMGDLGKVSRISGRLTGSALTFGTAGDASAPGQIPVEQLRGFLAELQ